MRAPQEKPSGTYEPTQRRRPQLRVIESQPQETPTDVDAEQKKKKRKVIVLERLKKVSEPRALKGENVIFLGNESYRKEVEAYEKYRAALAERRRIKEETTKGGLLWSKAIVADKMIRTKEQEGKASSEEGRNRKSWFTTSFWHNLPYATMAIFTGLNAYQVHETGTTPVAAEPARASTLEETRGPERGWAIQEQSTIVFGNPDSPFADLFDSEHETLVLPNQYFNRTGTSIYGNIEVRSNDSVTVSGPTLLERLWQLKTHTSKSHNLSLLGNERMAAYSSAIENGTLSRSSLSLEMARMAGFETGSSYTNAIWGNVRWEELGRRQELTADQLSLVRDISGFITPSMIEAIFLTELTPQMSLPHGANETAAQERQAQINIRLYDFLLRQYGTEFINNIPALGDSEVSVGAGQPTRYVLGEHRSTGIINNYMNPEAYSLLALPDGNGGIKHEITESPAGVSSLAEQRAIAYMNAIYNVLFTIQTNSQAREGFERIREAMVGDSPEMRTLAQEQIAQFLVAHNNPRMAAKALGAWNRHGSSLSLEEQLRIPVARFAEQVGHREYATSMRFNFAALDAAYAPIAADRELRGSAIATRGSDPTITFPADNARWEQIRRNMHQ